MDLETFVKQYRIAVAYSEDPDPEMQDSYRRHCRRVEAVKRQNSRTGSRVFNNITISIITKIQSYNDCQEYFNAHTSKGCINNANIMIEKMSDADIVTLTLLGVFDDE